MISLDSLVSNLQESSKSLASGLDLMTPDSTLEAQASAPEAAGDPAVIAYFANLLEDWCLKMESFLDDSDRSKFENPDAGPSVELEYWKRRLHRVAGVTDQLKTRECKNVIAVLATVTKQVFNNMIKFRLFML